MDVDALVAAAVDRIGKGGKKGKDGKGGKTGGKSGKKGKDGKGWKPKAKSRPDTQQWSDARSSGRGCYKCGSPDHYKRDCPQTSVNQLAGSSAQAPVVPLSSLTQVDSEITWLLMVSDSEDTSRRPGRLLVDSGAGRSTCPPGFALYAEHRQPIVPLRLITASGQEIRHEADATVAMITQSGMIVEADFAVASVSQPLLSVAGMCDKGYTVIFAPSGASVMRGDYAGPRGVPRLGLVRDGNLYWLEADPQPGQGNELQLCVARPEAAAQPAERTGGQMEVENDLDGQIGRVPPGIELYDDPQQVAEASGENSSSAPELRAPTSAGPKAKPTPPLPSPAERAAHELTHIPSRPWRRVCIQAKARSDGHRKRVKGFDKDDVLELHVDYCFITDGLGEEMTVACLSWPWVGSVFATVGVKGRSGFVARAIQAVLEVWGVNELVLRSDQEPAVMALTDLVRELRVPKVTIPQRSQLTSQSLGGGERSNQALQDQVRLLILSIAEKTGERIGLKHNLMSWAVRHSAWTLTRFVVKEHGTTHTQANIRTQKKHKELKKHKNT